MIDFQALGDLLVNVLLSPLLAMAGVMLALIAALAMLQIFASALRNE
jgi:hypothetical protein